MKRIHCRCGKVLRLPDNRAEGKFRCPSCGTIMRVRPAVESSADDYAVASDPQPAAEPARTMASNSPAAWAPAAGRSQPYRGRTHAASILKPNEKKSDETIEPDEFPGPFLDR